MGIKIIAKNKRAGFDFQLLEKIEAGIVLQGTEVKVLRENKVNLNESYVLINENTEAFAYNVLIPHYAFGNIHNHEEHRIKKLLLHKKEIARLYHEMKSKNLTLVVTMIYFKDSKVKIEIALARGKKMHDKRESEAKRDVERKLRQNKWED